MRSPLILTEAFYAHCSWARRSLKLQIRVAISINGGLHECALPSILTAAALYARRSLLLAASYGCTYLRTYPGAGRLPLKPTRVPTVNTDGGTLCQSQHSYSDRMVHTQPLSQVGAPATQLLRSNGAHTAISINQHSRYGTPTVNTDGVALCQSQLLRSNGAHTAISINGRTLGTALPPLILMAALYASRRSNGVHTATSINQHSRYGTPTVNTDGVALCQSQLLRSNGAHTAISINGRTLGTALPPLILMAALYASRRSNGVHTATSINGRTLGTALPPLILTAALYASRRSNGAHTVISINGRTLGTALPPLILMAALYASRSYSDLTARTQPLVLTSILGTALPPLILMAALYASRSAATQA
ncbi:hypothetical protein B0H11DRAFT_2248590 [Mycena galericulata]|nr:hypothetical protein B0H11DRAFT_2248590 [Mycena galericulata]